jgi:hypothetical protein
MTDDEGASRRPDQGFAGRVLRRLGVRRRGALNFSSRHDLESRWRLIAPQLPAAPRWFLDVGTNNGDTLRRLASAGHFGIGLEVARESAPEALPDNAAAMITRVTAATLECAPAFDGIFMLSVFHRIWAVQGPGDARAALRAAARRTRLLVFEGSSRHGRWTDGGQAAPGFDDMNADASVEWHRALLAESGEAPTVECLGITYSLKTREPRPLFVVRSAGPPR